MFALLGSPFFRRFIKVVKIHDPDPNLDCFLILKIHDRLAPKSLIFALFDTKSAHMIYFGAMGVGPGAKAHHICTF